MATKALLLSYLNRLPFSFLFIIFIHIGCFFISAAPTTTAQYQTRRNPTRTRIRKRKPFSSSSACGSNISSSFSSRLSRPKKLISSSWSFLKRTLLLISSSSAPNPIPPPWTGSQSNSIILSNPIKTTQAPDDVVGGDQDTTTTSTPNLPIPPVLPRKRRTGSRDFSSSAGSLALFPPLRNDIFPCPSCGEIFHRPHLLDHHRSTHHAVSELRDGDPGKNIVWIIFKTGWPDPINNNYNNNVQLGSRCRVTVHRILKVHSSPRILSRFEDYRESVKAKADTVYGGRKNNSNKYYYACNERCLVDGNELLRFHCTTFVCGLGEDNGSALCSHQCCSVCGIIRSGFSSKLVDDGISTMGTAWGAHLAVPCDVEAEFAFMGVKRAMLVCRVVAGRVGYGPAVLADEDCFDSVVVGRDAGAGNSSNLAGGCKSAVVDEELVVFNPRAVLPCFVIVYSIC